MCARFGDRFPAMSTAYDGQLRALADQVAVELNMKSFVQHAVYVYQTGPCLETVAECRMARCLGGDVIGTSSSSSSSPSSSPSSSLLALSYRQEARHHHHQVARPAVSIAVSTTERHLERSCERSHAELRPWLVGCRSDSMVRSQVRRGRPLRRRQSVGRRLMAA